MTYEQRNESMMADGPDLRGNPSPSSSLLDLSNLDLTCAEELISEAERNLEPIERGEANWQWGECATCFSTGIDSRSCPGDD